MARLWKSLLFSGMPQTRTNRKQHQKSTVKNVHHIWPHIWRYDRQVFTSLPIIAEQKIRAMNQPCLGYQHKGGTSKQNFSWELFHCCTGVLVCSWLCPFFWVKQIWHSWKLHFQCPGTGADWNAHVNAWPHLHVEMSLLALDRCAYLSNSTCLHLKETFG